MALQRLDGRLRKEALISEGGRLPTEAEWNYVAAGGDQQRAFPWSEPPQSLIGGTDFAVVDGAGAVGSTRPPAQCSTAPMSGRPERGSPRRSWDGAAVAPSIDWPWSTSSARPAEVARKSNAAI